MFKLRSNCTTRVVSTRSLIRFQRFAEIELTNLLTTRAVSYIRIIPARLGGTHHSSLSFSEPSPGVVAGDFDLLRSGMIRSFTVTTPVNTRSLGS